MKGRGIQGAFLLIVFLVVISSLSYAEVNSAMFKQNFEMHILPGKMVKTADSYAAPGGKIITVSTELNNGFLLQEMYYVNEATGTKVKLYVIGDSTASYYDSTRYPRTGWAQVLQAFFNNDSVEVVNKALSGRSSRSYYTDASGWPVVKPALTEGDYLFIQFGHNDSKDDERYTDPYTTYQEYLKKYIDEARAVGAIPVLLTSIHRNGWSGTSISDSHGDYPPAMRELAQEENVPLIDLHYLSEQVFEGYGQDFTTHNFFLNLPTAIYRYYPDGNSDNTHLQVRGAYEISKQVYRDILAQKDNAEIMKLYRGSNDAGYVSVLAHEFDKGKVNGERVIPMGEEASFEAVGLSGHVFDRYYLDGEMLLDANIQFTVTDSIYHLDANFVQGYVVRISVNPSYKADYEGRGTYRAGDEVTVTAIPDEGYRFVNWSKDGEIMSTDSVYTFTMDTVDIELVINVEEANAVKLTTPAKLKAYYDAANGHIHLQSPVNMEQIEMYNLSGQLILKARKQGREYLAALGDISPGIYLLKVGSANSNYIQKILIK